MSFAAPRERQTLATAGSPTRPASKEARCGAPTQRAECRDEASPNITHNLNDTAHDIENPATTKDYGVC